MNLLDQFFIDYCTNSLQINGPEPTANAIINMPKEKEFQAIILNNNLFLLVNGICSKVSIPVVPCTTEEERLVMDAGNLVPNQPQAPVLNNPPQDTNIIHAPRMKRKRSRPTRSVTTIRPPSPLVSLPSPSPNAPNQPSRSNSPLTHEPIQPSRENSPSIDLLIASGIDRINKFSKARIEKILADRVTSLNQSQTPIAMELFINISNNHNIIKCNEILKDIFNLLYNELIFLKLTQQNITPANTYELLNLNQSPKTTENFRIGEKIDYLYKNLGPLAVLSYEIFPKSILKITFENFERYVHSIKASSYFENLDINIDNINFLFTNIPEQIDACEAYSSSL
ncbi:hypothetical protein BD770DRAFT_416967 [Pilaira anomala]|nr:hypothetical protein BD770DRAFT_416967 [Pilaira anomala]